MQSRASPRMATTCASPGCDAGAEGRAMAVSGAGVRRSSADAGNQIVARVLLHCMVRQPRPGSVE